MATAAKQCTRCREANLPAGWECYRCGAKCCEHLCLLKTGDGKAICGTCYRTK